MAQLSTFPRFVRSRGLSNLHRPFLCTCLGLAPFTQKKRRRGRRGFSDPLGRLHEKLESADEVVTAKAGEIPGVPARLALAPIGPSKNFARWFSACFARPPVDLPCYPPLRASLASPGAHWHALVRSRQERPSDARQARRDRTTSAAAFISRVRDQMRPPLPAHTELRDAQRPVFRPERAHFICGGEGWGKFFSGIRGSGCATTEKS